MSTPPAAAATPNAPAATGSGRFRHIVVTTDFGECADGALRAGTELAGQLGATLTLVHAFQAEPIVDTNGLYLSVAERRSDAQGDLDHALSNARAIVPSATAILVEGEPAEAILGAVARTRADLLVMGTHGRGGLTRLLLGSVAEKVLRHSPVPVLTISSRTASGE